MSELAEALLDLVVGGQLSQVRCSGPRHVGDGPEPHSAEALVARDVGERVDEAPVVPPLLEREQRVRLQPHQTQVYGVAAEDGERPGGHRGEGLLQ